MFYKHFVIVGFVCLFVCFFFCFFFFFVFVFFLSFSCIFITIISQNKKFCYQELDIRFYGMPQAV